jgi:hypothetical protein
MKLGCHEIAELGNMISDHLTKCGVTNTSSLVIKVDKSSLTKIDEDLYYRQFPDGEDFIPSESEINIAFKKNLMITIKGEEDI